MRKLSYRTCNLIGRFVRDRRANAAVEFAVIVPLMLTMFFGTVEFSSGVAVNRKVTLVARNMSDLVSQSSSVSDTDITNFTTTGKAIMTPYDSTPLKATVSELYIDPATLTAKVKWSKGSSPRATDSTVSIPSALKIGGTYLIYSEVSYNYVPAVGYVMVKSGIKLSDFTFTRPRQSLCVLYSQTVCPT
ncbi:TadE/TadG family type IV pilus assembly protein [Bradyrhizobium sp.]|uniref:TadE/TadG family type IV pilus assembly protein n=1 Tax=Bradyrhizobium sp. TaxID=376 RepID=UPI0040381DF1